MQRKEEEDAKYNGHNNMWGALSLHSSAADTEFDWTDGSDVWSDWEYVDQEWLEQDEEIKRPDPPAQVSASKKKTKT